MKTILITICLIAVAIWSYLRITKKDKDKPSNTGGGTTIGEAPTKPIE